MTPTYSCPRCSQASELRTQDERLLPLAHPLRSGLSGPITVQCRCGARKTFDPSLSFQGALDESGWTFSA